MDSVTYDDGEIVGPDTMDMADKLIKKQLVELGFLKALSNMRNAADSAINQWLDERFSAADKSARDTHVSFATADMGTNYIRGKAPHAQFLMRSGGRQLLVKWVDSSLKEAEGRATLHRGGS